MSSGTKRKTKHVDKPVESQLSPRRELVDKEDAGNPPSAASPADAKQTGDGQAAKTFKDLGIIDPLCEACEALGYKTPTPIQATAIPLALQDRDMIGLAETGSGKTAAFALPILQSLLDKPQPLFGLVLAPTRELAVQIGKVFEALGSLIALRVAVLVGGLDMTPQAMALGKKPHIVVATPGRLLDHLEKTKGFSLQRLRYLVMDEADRLLEEMDFGPILEKILHFLPRERRTFLFSATMTTQVERLQRASLRDPLRAHVSDSPYATVKTLVQHYLFIPHVHKDTYLVYLLDAFAGRATIVFVRQQAEAQRLALVCRHLGLPAVPLHGGLAQSARLGALNSFRSGARRVLVATDVAARGLDIPGVDVVINYDLPHDSKTYIHRVGRTARAGRAGRSIAVVTQFDIEIYGRIEAALGTKLDAFPTERDEVMVFRRRVEEAQRQARMELRDLLDNRGKRGAVLQGKRGNVGAKKRRRDDMDAEEG